MKIKQLGIESNGTRSIAISCNEISLRGLIRSIRGIAGATVTDVAHDPMTDDSKFIITYKDIILTVETPFSDYVVNCSSSSDTFDEFVEKLSKIPVKWWDRIF